MFISPDRPDLTRALIHLTGDRPANTAHDALISILRDGMVHGSDHSGYVKGRNIAACFTEMPLSAVRFFIQHRRFTSHPYRPYGIAIHKVSAWDRGARPVIYLPDGEAGWIPEEEKWRHVRLEYGEVDFTHEREWRAKGNFSLNYINFYVLVPNKHAENQIKSTLSEDAERHILGFLHLDYLADFL